ncbi:C-5 sterol desaturase [Phakopsora pachyrhizi]|nr:C-5 sterol desaturase [Phakopsora pachyrhizi]
MDIILRQADDIFLDKLWARFFPLTGEVKSTSVIDLLPSISRPMSTSPISCLNSSFSQDQLCQISQLPRDNIVRQTISIFFLIYVGILAMYLILSSFSYHFLFDHELLNHPKFIRNQVMLEIKSSLKAIGPMDMLSVPWFLAEVRGHSMIYDNVNEIRGINISPILNYLDSWVREDGPDPLKMFIRKFVGNYNHDEFRILGGWTYLIFSFLLFFAFTDFSIYLVHRWEHHPSVYKHIHKAHHRWVIPTPFASYAFHPVDGYLQSVPYHIFVFIIPFHKTLFMICFSLITIWTILIHDSELTVGSRFEELINSPTHHTLHHLHFNCNYGQYLTWTDRFFNTYRAPTSHDRSFLKTATKNSSTLLQPLSSSASLVTNTK